MRRSPRSGSRGSRAAGPGPPGRSPPSALAAAVTFAVKPPKLPPGRLRVAVADLDNRTGDPALDGVGELFREALEQSKRVALLPRSSLVGALRDGGSGSPRGIGEAEVLAAARTLGGELALLRRSGPPEMDSSWASPR